MHAQLVFESILPPRAHPAPIVLLLGLATRIRKNFPALQLCSFWLCTWATQTITHMHACARAALAVDDPLERLHDDLVRALRNDPPAARRAILRAVEQVHKNAVALSAALDPHYPEI